MNEETEISINISEEYIQIGGDPIGFCIRNPEAICSFCKEDCYHSMKFAEKLMEKWGLQNPMHFECAIEALIDKKIKGNK